MGKHSGHRGTGRDGTSMSDDALILSNVFSSILGFVSVFSFDEPCLETRDLFYFESKSHNMVIGANCLFRF